MTNQNLSSTVFTSRIFTCQLSIGTLLSLVTNDFIAPTGGPSAKVNSSVPCVSTSVEAAKAAGVNKYMSVAWILVGGLPFVKIGNFSNKLLSFRTRSVAPVGGLVALYHSSGNSCFRSKAANNPSF